MGKRKPAAYSVFQVDSKIQFITIFKFGPVGPNSEISFYTFFPQFAILGTMYSVPERPFGFAFPHDILKTSANLFLIWGLISWSMESRRSWYLTLLRSSWSLLFSSSLELTFEEYELKGSWSLETFDPCSFLWTLLSLISSHEAWIDTSSSFWPLDLF